MLLVSVLVTVVIVLLWALSPRVLESVARASLNGQLNGRVSWSRFQWLSGNLRLSDVEVCDVGGNLVLGAEAVDASYRPSRLWQGVAAIDSLTVEHPRLQIRVSQDGRSNLAGLFKTKVAAPAAKDAFGGLRALVRIDDGRVDYRDERGRGFSAPVDGMMGLLDLRSERDFSSHLTARQGATPCQVEWAGDRRLLEGRARVELTDLSLPTWAGYLQEIMGPNLPPLAQAHVESGRATIEAVVELHGPWQGWNRSIEPMALIRVSGLTAASTKLALHLRAAQGQALVATDLVSFQQCSGLLEGDAVGISGRVYCWHDPQIDLNVTLSSADVHSTARRLAVLTALPVGGAATAEVRLVGSLRDIGAQGHLQSNHLRVVGRDFHAVDAYFDLVGGDWRVLRASAAVAGGTVRACGWLFPHQSPTMLLQVLADKVPLRTWLAGASGRGDGDLVLVGSQHFPLVLGTAAAQGAQLAGVNIAAAAPSFLYDSRRHDAFFSNLSAHTSNGDFQSANGWVELTGAQRIYASLRGQGVAYTASDGTEGIDHARLGAVVSGTIGRLKVAADLQGASLHRDRFHIDNVGGGLLVSPDLVWMPSAVFSWQGNSAKASLFLDRTDRPGLDVSLRSSKIDALGAWTAVTGHPVPFSTGAGPLRVRVLGDSQYAAFAALSEAAGGTLAIHGNAQPQQGRFAGVAQADHLDASLLGLSTWHPRGRLAVSGWFGSHPGGFTFDACANGQKFSVGGFPFRTLSLSADSMGGGLQVSHAGLLGKGGQVEMSGHIPLRSGRWDVRWRADNLMLDGLAQRLNVGTDPNSVRASLRGFRLQDLEGLAGGRGFVNGPLGAMQVGGEARIDEAVLHRQSVVARAGFLMGSHCLSLQGVRASLGGERMDGHAQFHYLPSHTDVDMQVGTRRFDLRRLLAFTSYGGLVRSGWLEAALHLQGPIQALSASGRVKLHNAQIAGQSLDDAVVTLAAKRGSILVQDLLAHVSGGTVSGYGAVNARGPLHMLLHAQNFPLQEVQGMQQGGRLLGRGDFWVAVGGTLNSPRVRLDLSLPSIQAGTAPPLSARGEVLWVPPLLSVHNLVLTVQGVNGVTTLGGSLDFAQKRMPRTFDEFLTAATNPRMDVTVRLSRAGLASLVGWLPVSWRNQLHGTVDGTLIVRGRPQHADVQGDLHGTDLQVGQAQIGEADTNFRWEGLTRTLRQLKLSTRGGAGTLDINGATDADADFHLRASNFDVSVVGPFVPWRFPVGGRLDSAIDLTSPRGSPVLRGAFQVTHGVLAGLLYDRLGGTLSGDNDIYRLGDFELVRGTHRLSLSGDIPMRLQHGQVVFPAPMDVSGVLTEDSLDIMSLFIPDMLDSPGALHAKFAAHGTYPDIKLEADMSIHRGSVRNKNLSVPIENLEAAVTVRDGRLQINNCTGSLGKGAFTLAGDADVSGFSLSDMNFNLRGKELSLGYSPYLSSVSDVDLHLIGSIADPFLGGSIRARTARFSLPLGKLAEQQPGRGAPIGLPLETMKVKVYLGSDTWLRYLGSTVRAEGELDFAGKAPQIAPTGRVSLHGGQLQIPGLPASFRVVSGAAHFRGTWTPTLEASALSQVGSYEVYLDVSGTPAKPDVRLSSNPPLSQQSIRQLLLSGTVSNPYNPSIYTPPGVQHAGVGMGALLNVAEATFLHPVTSVLGQFFALTEVATDFAQPGAIQFTIYKAVDQKQKLFLTFTSLQGTPQQQQSQLPHSSYGIEFRFRPNRLIRISTDDKGGYHLFYQARWRF